MPAQGAVPAEVYKLSSREGHIFEMDRKTMEMIKPVRILFGAGGLDQIPLEILPPIQLDIPTVVLRKLVEWCAHHKNDPEDHAEWAEEGIPEWDFEFLSVRYSLLFDIIRAARDYEIPALFDMCCRIVGQNPHEILHGLVRDYDDAEEELAIIRAASYAAA